MVASAYPRPGVRMLMCGGATDAGVAAPAATGAVVELGDVRPPDIGRVSVLLRRPEGPIRGVRDGQAVVAKAKATGTSARGTVQGSTCGA